MWTAQWAWSRDLLSTSVLFNRHYVCITAKTTIANDIGCMGMMALGHEDFNGQLRVSEHGGIQPLVRLLRIPRTSSQVILAVICALASLCVG